MEESFSFSTLLQEELQRRQADNRRYSLRSFARMLGLSSSFLSKLMNGKRSASKETFLKIASRLQLPDQEVSALSQSLTPKSKELQFAALQVDQFKLIADWHHYAILEYASLHDFVGTPESVAARLSISEDRARSALERLTRLGLLSLDPQGRLLGPTKDHTAVRPGPLTAANREHERQILEGAIRALAEVERGRRHQSSMTLGIPESRLPEAVSMLRKFRREFTATLQRPARRDAVYQLSLAFYPVTTKALPSPKAAAPAPLKKSAQASSKSLIPKKQKTKRPIN
jgi:transcriptional regulator with XRE-family HTH domain